MPDPPALSLSIRVPSCDHHKIAPSAMGMAFASLVSSRSQLQATKKRRSTTLVQNYLAVWAPSRSHSQNLLSLSMDRCLLAYNTSSSGLCVQSFATFCNWPALTKLRPHG